MKLRALLKTTSEIRMFPPTCQAPPEKLETKFPERAFYAAGICNRIPSATRATVNMSHAVKRKFYESESHSPLLQPALRPAAADGGDQLD
jgi:hypothetical protein